LKLVTSILRVNIKAPRRRTNGRSVFTSISIFVYIDTETPLIEYRTQCQSTSISKFRHFDIALKLNIVPDIKVLRYRSLHTSIATLCTRYRTFFKNFDYKLRYRSCVRDIKDFSETSISKTKRRYRMSKPQISISKIFTRFPRYLKFVDVEEVNSISKVLLRSLFQGQSHFLSNEC
jgi:hypothetical protein